MMKLLKLASYLNLIVLFYSVQTMAQPGFGTSIKINDSWGFVLSGTDTNDILPPVQTHWQTVNLPHDWSVKQKLSPQNASSMGYLPGGIGWYKKNLYIPKKNNKVYLYFEGIYNRSEVFINGHLAGKRPNGYISFMLDITPYISYNKTNEILVRVDHHHAADSRWYSGSGIYRDVWLIYANPLHISKWGVYASPQLEKNNGVLNIETSIENNSQNTEKVDIISELFSPSGKIIATNTKSFLATANERNKINTQLAVSNPQLWSLEHPVLYKLKTRILKNGKQIDENNTTTGFRSFIFDPNNGFALNEKWLKVKGVCLHHDAGVLGAAVYKDVWRRRLLKLKEIGVNAIRTSHNPQAPALYELCDELGLLVMDEAFDEWKFPKRKWIEGWNIGTPGFEGTYDFFDEWSERDLADMVQRDRNHISIFAWSIGNEVDYPNDPYSHPILDGASENGFTQKIFGGYNKKAPDAMELGVIAKKLATVVRKYDSSRPVTAGLAGVAMSNETGYPSALDIAGYNYTESRYISDHKKYPSRVIFGSENRHDLSAWKAVTDNRHIFGQFLWTGVDYLGESGKWPSRGFYSGLIDFAGFIKPRGYFRKSLWDENPMAYIGTYPTPGKDIGNNNPTEDVLSQTESSNKEEKTPSMDGWSFWNYTNGQSIRVVCYTNAEKARLLLNDKQVGETKNYDNNTGIIYWDIPYQAGTLKVQGLNNIGKIISTYDIKTSGTPYALQLIKNDATDNYGKEVVQIALQIVDNNGIPVRNADNEVTCNISGNASLLGLEAGNNSDMGNYTDNKQKTYHGKLMAYIRRTGKLGKIKITFTSQGIKPVEILL
jgi:beta-galactosidase